MNTALKKSSTIAASAALLGGAGLVAAAPAQAAPASAASVTEAAVAPAVKGTSAPVIVYRSGAVTAKASISAAPKVAPTKKKKKRYKSRRS